MRRWTRRSVAVFCLSAVALSPADDGAPRADHRLRIDLPVVATTDRYPPYDDFCRRQPPACTLEGAPIIEQADGLLDDLQQVSREINRAVRFTLDSEIYSVEDYWALPTSGFGDCEDVALAKRVRLVAMGYPSAALRLAFVFSPDALSAHCVLTAETALGTFVLDSFTDAVVHWTESGYNFEARERPDGRWERYDQSLWQYARPPGILP
jgi:predicted transglutaminase-like cysteine proteinase